LAQRSKKGLESIEPVMKISLRFAADKTDIKFRDL
jgi:hypothetical protein